MPCRKPYIDLTVPTLETNGSRPIFEPLRYFLASQSAYLALGITTSFTGLISNLTCDNPQGSIKQAFSLISVGPASGGVKDPCILISSVPSGMKAFGAALNHG